MKHEESRQGRCYERLRQINNYIDGEIDDELCQELERHMEHCPDCQVIVDTLTRTVKLYRSLAQTQSDLPADVEQRLLSRLNLPV